MSDRTQTADRKIIEELAGKVFADIGGAMNTAMIWLGDHLGLYRAMHGAEPTTTEQLAEQLGLHERWVREWLHGQATAGYVDYLGDGRFALTAEAGAVLADEMHPYFCAGGTSHMPQLLVTWEMN